MPANVTAANITVGPGQVLYSPRDTTPITVTATASPAPTTTVFAVSAADAAKLKVGDILSLASAANTYLAPEASTMPMIVSIGTEANPVITVSPAFSGAPPTTAGGVRVIWHDLGSTDGGIELSAKKDVTDHFVDQSVAPVASSDDKLEVIIRAPLAEATLKNFAIVTGIADPSSATVLQVSSTASSRTDRFLFIGTAPNSKRRFAVINKGKSKGTAQHKSAKGEKTIYVAEIQAYADSTKTPDLLDITDAT